MASVAVVVFEGVQSLDVSGPLDVFAEANRLLPPEAAYELKTISIEGPTVTCTNAMNLTASAVWTQPDLDVDILLVAGGLGLASRQFDEGVYAWLRATCARARRYGSICNGALVFAKAGMLKGRTVTTHWDSVEALTSTCPGCFVEPDRIYIQDGSLYTSAGVSAGIDLALHILRQEQGAEIALNVAKRLVVVMQRTGGQSQFSPYLNAPADSASPIAEAQRYVLANLRQPLTVSELAGVAKMSVRSFARAFAREAGLTPADFVQRARVDAARALLEMAESPIKTIAYECGFGDASRMRNAFVRSVGVSPQHYRRSFNHRGG